MYLKEYAFNTDEGVMARIEKQIAYYSWIILYKTGFERGLNLNMR
jgi:hypothetical protein